MALRAAATEVMTVCRPSDPHEDDPSAENPNDTMPHSCLPDVSMNGPPLSPAHAAARADVDALDGLGFFQWLRPHLLGLGGFGLLGGREGLGLGFGLSFGREGPPPPPPPPPPPLGLGGAPDPVHTDDSKSK